MGFLLCLLRECVGGINTAEGPHFPPQISLIKEVDSELDFIILCLSKFWC